MSGESEASGEVLRFQFREVIENLFLRHSAGEIFEDIFHRDAHAPDARLSTALVRRYRNALIKVHGVNVVGYGGFGEDSFCDGSRVGAPQVGLIRPGQPTLEICRNAHSRGSEIPRQNARLTSVSLPLRDNSSSVFNQG